MFIEYAILTADLNLNRFYDYNIASYFRELWLATKSRTSRNITKDWVKEVKIYTKL